MEILDHYEASAEEDIQRDRAINADPYESVGRHVLIRKIKRKIQKELDTDDKEAA